MSENEIIDYTEQLNDIIVGTYSINLLLCLIVGLIVGLFIGGVIFGRIFDR